MTTTIKISFEIDSDQAVALAQLTKRICHDDCVRMSGPEEDPYEMLFATDKLRQALADAGISVR